WKNSVYPIQPDDKFLQKSPYTFDVSAVELFLVHWFGGSVVFANPGGHKDPDYLKSIIDNQSITMIHFVPSMLDVFLDTLTSEKDNLPKLRLVVCSGEALQFHTVKKFYERIKNTKLYNLYGPTEASVDVLMYDCKEIKGNEVYIGKPIANTQAYVLDENRMPLPVGAVGELYIGGVQLAREYINQPKLTAEKFVIGPFHSQQRLYKTGDLVKWMPDGNIAYLGRNDNQVKMRGYRIELDEIGAVLSNHYEVNQAVVEVKEYGGSQHLVAYCVKKLELDESDEKDFVTTWGTLFDSEYASMEGTDIRLNVKGWKSSYTGLPISPAEMHEWTHETVKRIQALGAKVILEIGSGSGLILFNIIDRCERYYATDISQNVITYTDKIVNQYQLQDKVVTACCVADDIPYEKFQKPYDTVVINSVVQLFPNIDYLEGVILEAIAYMGDKGQVFIGDVRDYRLLHCFHFSVLKYKNGETTKAEVDHFVRREKELLISPAYFAYLQATIPHITHIEIMPKMGIANHEMNMFRYDVVLHIDKKGKLNRDSEVTPIEHGDFVLVEDCLSYMDSNPKDILCMKYVNKRVLNDYTSYYGLKIDENQEPLGINAIAEEAKLRGYQVKFYLDLHDSLFLCIVLFRNKKVKVNFPRQSQRSDCANDPLISSKLVENSFTQKLKEYLSAKLPEFMIPEQYILLDALPVTSNGKLDRKALPDVGFISSSEYVAPRNELESQVHVIWADLLGLPGEKVSIAVDFFRLGGNSILAIKLANQLSKNLQQDVKVSDIFTYTSIEKLVQSLSGDKQKKISIDKGVFTKVKEQVLSFAQERLWFIQRYENGTNVYNIPMVYQLNHKVDDDVLKQSLLRIVERHEVLRTLVKEDFQGNGYQQVLDCAEFHLEEIKVETDQLDRELDKEINHIFDLSEEIPTRMRLFHTSDGCRFLCIVIHHIAFDGWSLDVFLKELEAYYAFYAGATTIQPHEPKLQYKDFAHWQRNYLQGERLEQQLSYWKGKLEGYETLNLVTDKQRPQEIDYFGSDVFFKFDSRLSTQLRVLAQELKVSLYSLLLSAYYLMLRVYSHQDDLVVGTPIANRHYTDIDEMIGFFVNSLVLRYKISSERTLNSYIRDIANTVANAQLHQDLPFEKLVAELDIIKDKSRHPLFQVMFTVQSFGGQLENPAVQHHERSQAQLASIMTPYDKELRLFQAAYFDITTFIDDSKEELEGRFNYATSLFHHETVSRYISTFEHILRQFVAANSRNVKIGKITYVNDFDCNTIVNEWNQTAADYPKMMKVHQLFEHYAAQHSDASAVLSEGLALSYAELNKRA
ncbi:MAG: condensation domain-containing protein, partial [Waddliaceae bacterium]